MEIVKREILFHSDKIFSVMKNGKLYVGVSNICLNLGMTIGMRNRQILNLQKDIVLSKGCVKFDTGVFDEYNQTLAIELEYLPIWLAKIRITPNMLEEKKELVEKLIDYQLHCKDILADEFFGKRQLPENIDFKNNPQLREIKDRVKEAYRIEEQIKDLTVQLINEYELMGWRSGDLKEQAKRNYKNALHKKIEIDGREIDYKEVNELGKERLLQIKKDLEEE